MKRKFLWGGLLSMLLLSACGSHATATHHPTPPPSVGYLCIPGQCSAWRLDTGGPLWRASLTYGTQPHAVLNGTTLYVASGGIMALRVKDGSVLWRIPLQDAAQVSEIVVVEGLVYLETSTEMYAFGATDGTLRWRYDHQLAIPSLVVGNGMVYLTANVVVALDAHDGTKKWETPLAQGFYTTQAAQSLTLVGTTLYVTSQSDSFYVFDAATGQQKWGYQSPGSLSPLVFGADGTLYVATLVVPVVAQGATTPMYTVIAMNPTTGAALWKRPLAIGNRAFPGTPPPVVAGDFLYVLMGPTDGDVVALARSDGSQRWHLLGTQVGQQLVPSASGVILILQDGSMVAYATTGATVWQQTAAAGAGLIQLLGLQDGLLYLAGTSGRMTAIKSVDGTTRWQTTSAVDIAVGQSTFVTEGVSA